MIIKRGVKIQLLVFALITALGVSYTLVRYLGVGSDALGRTYTTYVDLTDSGGVFTNAEVTYRGVAVGRVGPIELTRDGIKVRLELRRGHRIPRQGTVAVVANRSAVGEQYIDLQPVRAAGPYLDEGRAYTIPRSDTRLPVSTHELLANTDKLISSVNPQHLGTIVDELNKAFSGSAADLQAILDASDRLLKTAEEAYPATAELIDNSRIVLDTQRSQGGNIRQFARNLNVLTDQLRKDDPALRATLDAAPPAAKELDATIADLAPTLPVLLANMTTVGQIVHTRVDGLRSLFILYPLAVGGAFTVTPGDGTQHLGLVLNLDSPPPCTRGYEKVKKRWPQDTRDRPNPLDVGCKEPKTSPQVPRGARNAPPPRPAPALPPGATAGAGAPPGGVNGSPAASGGPGQAAGQGEPTVAYVPLSAEPVALAGYDPATGAVYGPDGKRYQMGSTGGQRRLLGDASWKWLLLGPLSR
ncbi:MCE family protein [Actinomadura craniellae]|uniref:MCE family protein n=1 Tax=Actinomadura craniellae TaxID=2231787 RepID=A0A365H7V7_9ACTN|nr:MlaD family protein [Actinomadura craniellae]RAY15167.1 MCE family protein [Actinomadura craniellae]